MQNPGRGRVGPPGPPGKQGSAGPKGSKGILGRENNKDLYEGKNENCKTPTVNAVEGENETRFVISVCMFQ